MKVSYSPHFQRHFKHLSPKIQQKFAKQIALLLSDFNYPSLHTKKYDERRKIWQARVDRDVRFYFLIEGDLYNLLDIKHHPK